MTIATLIAICGASLSWYFIYEFTPTQMDEKEKWVKYERALGQEILNSANTICEWMLLGQSDQEVYVWAECKIADPEARIVHMSLATIYLDSGGGIESVELQKDFQDIPPEIHEKVFPISGSDIEGLMSHIYERQENPGPPSIVLWGTPLP